MPPLWGYLYYYCLGDYFTRITGKDAASMISNPGQVCNTGIAIIIGSVSRSPTMQRLIQDGKLDISAIDG